MGKYSSYLVLYNVYFCYMVRYISYFIESSKKTWAKCEEPRICQTEKWRWGFFEELVKPATSQISYKVNFCLSKHIISIIYNILLPPGVEVSSSKKSLRICRFFTFSSKTRSISLSSIISTYGNIRRYPIAPFPLFVCACSAFITGCFVDTSVLITLHDLFFKNGDT